MPKKRGSATSYTETKVKVGVSLTPTSAEKLKEVAKELGLSRSELVERIARGDLAVLREAAKITTNLKNQSDIVCLLYTSPSPRDSRRSRMPSSA